MNMKNARVVTALLLVMVTGFLNACREQDQPASPRLPASAVWTLPVTAIEAGVPVDYSSIGSVVSDQRVDVSSRVSGYVRTLEIHEGDTVRAGQLLLRLDATDINSAIAQARAALTGAEAAERDAVGDEQATKILFEKGSASINDVRKMTLRATVATEQRKQADVALQTALAQQQYVEIRSPLDGLVVARDVRVGSLASPGARLLTLESKTGLVFETYVPETTFRSIDAQTPVSVQIDGVDGNLAGRILRRVASADPVTRSYQVKIALPATTTITPGMYGRAVFQLGINDSPVLPEAARVKRGGLTGAYVLDADGQARFRWLRFGREWPDRAEVTAGLEVGEHVVLNAPPAFREGDTVLVTGAGHE